MRRIVFANFLKKPHFFGKDNIFETLLLLACPKLRQFSYRFGGLSDDKNKLIVSGLGTATRISKDKFNELNKIEQKRIADAKKCNELRHQARKENPKAFNQFILFGEDKLRAEQTKKKYENKAKEMGFI